MAGLYDQEFNRVLPGDSDAPELSPYGDKVLGSKRSYSLRKLVALLAGSAAVLSMAVMASFSVDKVDTDSAELFYEIEITEGSEEEAQPEFRYELCSRGELILSEELQEGEGSIVLDGLQPDTRYILYIWRDDTLERSIRFRTQPLPLEQRIEELTQAVFAPQSQPQPPIPSATVQPRPSPSPSPSPLPSPSASPSPTPAPTPSPAPTAAPYIPPAQTPAPAVPKPIPATPAPTDPPQVWDGTNPDDPDNTTPPDTAVMREGLNPIISGSGGDYTIQINPSFVNPELYTIERVGLAVMSGSTRYSSAEYFTADIEAGYPLTVGHSYTGNFTLEVQIGYTVKSTGMYGSFMVYEPVTVTKAAPSLTLLGDYGTDDSGNFSLTFGIEPNDYSLDDITNVYAYWYDTDGNSDVVAVSAGPDNYSISISADEMATIRASTSGYVYLCYALRYSGGDTPVEAEVILLNLF